MFETSIAFKYLTPRWRQLSVSIISLISILVIALVVWLIVVFFSVTAGLERNWIDRLIALTAPVRIVPTDAYYNSYYYNIDRISQASGYNQKSIAEKLQASITDPYDPSSDEEVPAKWAAPDRHANGELKDLVKVAFEALRSIPGIEARDYEMTMANLRLNLIRQPHAPGHYEQASLSQATYLGSFDPDNRALQGALLPLSMQDLSNQLSMSAIAADPSEDGAQLVSAGEEQLRERLKAFFSEVTIRQMETPEEWMLPKELWPQSARWRAYALFVGDRLVRVLIPKEGDQFSESVVRGFVEFQGGQARLILPGKEAQEIPSRVPLVVIGKMVMDAEVNKATLNSAKSLNDVLFDVAFKLQGKEIKGQIPYANFKISKAEVAKDRGELPSDSVLGRGILLPRGFKDAGVLVGDRGSLVYAIPSASSLQEQRLPIFVAGFYDPGIIPIGGKFLIVPQEITSVIRSAYNQDDLVQGNGINVRFKDIDRADQVKMSLQRAFEEAGIANYWKIETYREYDFTKDVIQQLSSEKNLFTLLATIIIIVACSNIISMLIILVNDKKLEIGILRSMGASSGSIAAIFGLCGIVMGVLGSAIGILVALFTLQHLQKLVNLISRVQGHDLFNPIYYGETLPSQLSWEAIGFVIVTTAFISLISGLVPAIKASMMRPSAILRAE